MRYFLALTTNLVWSAYLYSALMKGVITECVTFLPQPQPKQDRSCQELEADAVSDKLMFKMVHKGFFKGINVP